MILEGWLDVGLQCAIAALLATVAWLFYQVITDDGELE